MLCEPLMQSMCSLRHQCHSHGSLPHPVHHCPACAPEARRVVSALAEGIEMPARAPDAGSCTHSHFHMRVRAADPHSHMQARSSCVLYSRFPGSPASDSRFPGRNGRHRAGIRRETWNPHRKRPGPSHPEGAARPARIDRGSTLGPTQKTNPRQTQRWPLGSSERPPHHVKGSRLTKNAPAHPQRRRTTTSGSPSPVVVRTLSMPRV